MDTPRDVRLLHLILAAQNVQSYDPHVPLMLMDFAHRYTSQVLQDAIIYNDYANPVQTNAGNQGNSGVPLTNEDIRLAVAARTAYQFKPVPGKKAVLELARERNEKPLPAVVPMWGLRLPPEKYCLTNSDTVGGVNTETNPK
ncbi:hypothetical protein DAMA08_053700 [Martiniozyma asiatica (nom. inval.)]|nr:hypothetical protein DAMA08_053700 [Martiniozyma asiatica]